MSCCLWIKKIFLIAFSVHTWLISSLSIAVCSLVVLWIWCFGILNLCIWSRKQCNSIISLSDPHEIFSAVSKSPLQILVIFSLLWFSGFDIFHVLWQTIQVVSHKTHVGVCVCCTKKHNTSRSIITSLVSFLGTETFWSICCSWADELGLKSGSSLLLPFGSARCCFWSAIEWVIQSFQTRDWTTLHHSRQVLHSNPHLKNLWD